MKKLFNEFDNTVFGVQKNQIDQLRYYFTHNHVFFLPKTTFTESEPWDAEFQFDLDHKQSKFLSRERNVVLRLGPQASPWRLKFEGAMRKNITDYYASREFIKNETLISYKESLGLQYNSFTESTFKKFELEVALPLINVSSPAFFKVDGFMAQNFQLVEDKLKAVVQLQGGMIRPMFG